MRIGRTFSRTAVAFLFLATTLPAAQGKIIYVDDDASPPGDGTSWTAAYRFLQDALASVSDSDESVEIRVAQGIYKPDQGANQVAGDTETTFHLPGGISLRGGFAGLGHPDPNARDISVFETVLSADLAGDDLPVVHAMDMLPDENRSGNSFSVLVVQDPNGTAIIEGLTITGGDCTMETWLPSGGAGIWCREESSPTIRNCTLTANSTFAWYGGAIFGGAPRIIDCTFDRNYTEFGGAVGYCGGSIHGCRFINNAAGRGGGALSEHTGSIHDCSFIGNVANQRGGALDECTGTVTNCVFVGNSADDGGAVFLRREGNLTLSNCTFAQNVASTGRALSCRPYGQDRPVTVDLTNCILWNGGDEIRSLAGSTVEIRYSDVQGSQAGIDDPCETVVWGPGNMEADPCFADPGYWDANGTADDPNDDFFIAGDYHLKSEVGRWDPNSGSWVADDATSPCIDAGDPNSDLSGEVWPHGGRINMGAYGGTAQASMSDEPTEMSLPRVTYVYRYDRQKAESFQSFLKAHGCSVTLLRSDVMAEPALDDYDLVMIGTDTQNPAAWPDDHSVTALIDSGKPIIGLGDGGYRFFGKLGLAIGYPNGASGTFDSVSVVDPNSSLFDTPYPVAVPADGVLKLCSIAESCAMIYLWPAPPTVTTLGGMVGDSGYYPLVAEQGHLLWGFAGSPEQMTEAGQRLFLNAVILTANGRLESSVTPTP